jgi:beta-glucosidase
MRRSPGRGTPRHRPLALGLTLLLATSLAAVAPTAAAQTPPPYKDPAQPVSTRVNDLLGRMSLDEKIGQMTQVERTALQSQSDLATFRIGSVLSGGGSAPSPNNATSWANMYDGFQQTALSTPLGIPIIYGADAVHGHNNVVGANIGLVN